MVDAPDPEIVSVGEVILVKAIPKLSVILHDESVHVKPMKVK